MPLEKLHTNVAFIYGLEPHTVKWILLENTRKANRVIVNGHGHKPRRHHVQTSRYEFLVRTQTIFNEDISCGKCKQDNEKKKQKIKITEKGHVCFSEQNKQLIWKLKTGKSLIIVDHRPPLFDGYLNEIERLEITERLALCLELIFQSKVTEGSHIHWATSYSDFFRWFSINYGNVDVSRLACGIC